MSKVPASGSICHLFNAKISNIWTDFSHIEQTRKAPLFFHELRQRGLIFIGLNPSDTIRANSCLRGSPYQNINPLTYFDWSVVEERATVENLVEIHLRSVQYYSYFNRMREIAESAQTDWDHVDVFAYRNRNQKEIERLVYSQDENVRLFFARQGALFRSVLRYVNPMCIVVVNAFASKLIREWYTPAWNEGRGCHFMAVSGGRMVPIFFSGMLSGQRALDTGSFERLSWHVRSIISDGRLD